MKNLSIKTKLVMSFAAIVFLNLCFGFNALRSLAIMNFRVEDANAWTEGVWQTTDIHQNVTSLRRMDLLYIVGAETNAMDASGVKSQRAGFVKGAEDMMNTYREEVMSMAYDTEEQRQDDLAIIDGIIDGWKKYLEASDKIISLTDARNLREARSLATGDSKALFEAMEENIIKMASYNMEGSEEGMEFSRKIYASMRGVILAFMAVILVFSVVVTMLLTKGIKKPVEELLRVAKAVGDGDLTVSAGVYSRDDLGVLSERYNVTIGKIKSIVSQIQNSAENLAGSINGLNYSAEQTAAESSAIASNMEKTSLGANRQMSEIESMTSTILGMRDQIADEADSIEKLANASRASLEKAKVGERSIESAVEQMGMISVTVDASSKVVTSLGARSDEIGAIVETIAGISSQTNLLALNAAIEAARAGEHGLGFAVVAAEVKKLAGESSAAAEEIAKLIAGIQEETNRAVASMKTGIDEAKKGSAPMEESGQVFKELVGMSVDSADRLQNLVAVIKEISASVDDVVNAARELERTSREIADDSQSVMASTQAQTASVSEISSASQDLSHVARELLDAANQFESK
ncbi:MAG: methyl-accepting chemotaxis protein [Synergistaceae bacterium]|nr:methyl-accepting chemotaxis protein [Synergistaceae bacterium]